MDTVQRHFTKWIVDQTINLNRDKLRQVSIETNQTINLDQEHCICFHSWWCMSWMICLSFWSLFSFPPNHSIFWTMPPLVHHPLAALIGTKLQHQFSSNTKSHHFFFTCLPRRPVELTPHSWPIDLFPSQTILGLKWFSWSQFLMHFDSSNLCSYHFRCPCNNNFLFHDEAILQSWYVWHLSLWFPLILDTVHCGVGLGVARPTHRTQQCSIFYRLFSHVLRW